MMKAKLYLSEMAIAAGLGLSGGALVGFLWGTGLLDLIFSVIPSRHGTVRHHSSYWKGMTRSEWESNILWYPVYGAAAGTVLGATYGFFSAREALEKNEASRASHGSAAS